MRYYCEMCLPGVGLPLFSSADAFFSTGTVGGVASQFIPSIKHLSFSHALDCFEAHMSVNSTEWTFAVTFNL